MCKLLFRICCVAGVLSVRSVRPSNNDAKSESATLAEANASVSANSSHAELTGNPSPNTLPKKTASAGHLAEKTHTDHKAAATTEPTAKAVEEHLGTSAKQILPADATPEEIEKDALDAGSTSDQQAQEEKILSNEEDATLGAGVDKLTLAVNDPRAFLMGLPGMQHFVTGLRVAIDLQPTHLVGKCLQSGKFQGFGCSKLDGERPVCQCAGTLEKCWVDEDASIVATFNSGRKAEAFERAKSLLFGQCYTPTWVVVILIGGLLISLASSGVFIYFFTRQPKSADPSGDLPTFPSLSSAISAFYLRMRAA